MSIYSQPWDFCIPADESEMPEEFLEQARDELRADTDWLAEQIAEAMNGPIAKAIIDGRDGVACEFIRAAVNAAIEREAQDLAEDLWRREIESSRQDAIEYAADCRADR